MLTNWSQTVRKGRTEEMFVANSDLSQRRMKKSLAYRDSSKGWVHAQFWNFFPRVSYLGFFKDMNIHRISRKVGRRFLKQMYEERGLTNKFTVLILLLNHSKTSFYMDSNLRDALPFWHKTLCITTVCL